MEIYTRMGPVFKGSLIGCFPFSAFRIRRGWRKYTCYWNRPAIFEGKLVKLVMYGNREVGILEINCGTVTINVVRKKSFGFPIIKAHVGYGGDSKWCY